MRDLAQRFAATGDTEEAALMVEREQVEEDVRELQKEIGDLEARLSKKQRDLDRIDTRIEQRRESITEEARKYAETAMESPRPLDEMLAHDNPAVENHAAKAGKSVDEFVYEVRRVVEE
jgi:chromosome segregation ATPase